MSAECDVGHMRQANGPAKCGRVAGVYAAGDVGRGDGAKERCVIRKHPCPERLSEVAVEVDWSHGSAGYHSPLLHVGGVRELFNDPTFVTFLLPTGDRTHRWHGSHAIRGTLSGPGNPRMELTPRHREPRDPRLIRNDFFGKQSVRR